MIKWPGTVHSILWPTHAYIFEKLPDRVYMGRTNILGEDASLGVRLLHVHTDQAQLRTRRLYYEEMSIIVSSSYYFAFALR